MNVPIARVEPLGEKGVNCSFNRHGRGTFRPSACTRYAGWRCIIRPIGWRRDKRALRYCTERAREWARRHRCDMPLSCELHGVRQHWTEVRDGQ